MVNSHRDFEESAYVTEGYEYKKKKKKKKEKRKAEGDDNRKEKAKPNRDIECYLCH